MLIQIVCTCGRSIGDLYEAFDMRRQELINKNKNDILPERLQDSGNNISIELGQILDDYKVEMICCRRILLSSVNFFDLMNKSYLSLRPKN